jgi:hypothetical protein
MNAYFFSIKPEERENILSQHREVYNGYQTLNPAAMEKTQPLYTQDFANDKLGMVVNNKGEVKSYTNMGINESISKKLMEQEVCEQCSEEIEEIYADDMDVSDEEGAYDFKSDGPVDVYGTMQDYDKETGSYHKIDSMKDVERYDDSSDINNMFGDLVDGLAFNDDESSDTFQHDSGDIDREGDGNLGMDTEDDMDLSSVKPAYTFTSDGPDDPYGVSEDEDLEEMVDEDLRESFKEKRKLVMEMMNRMSKF